LPQKTCPFWFPHPEQVGFSSLRKKWQVSQYVSQDATSFSFKHQTSSPLEFSSGIICFVLGSSCFHCLLVMGG
jgi:hypothetical protein